MRNNAEREAAHTSTYFRTGRPATHFRKCSCGWVSGGMGKAEWAKEAFDEHVSEATRLPCPQELVESSWTPAEDRPSPSGRI